MKIASIPVYPYVKHTIHSELVVWVGEYHAYYSFRDAYWQSNTFTTRISNGNYCNRHINAMPMIPIYPSSLSSFITRARARRSLQVDVSDLASSLLSFEIW